MSESEVLEDSVAEEPINVEVNTELDEIAIAEDGLAPNHNTDAEQPKHDEDNAMDVNNSKVVPLEEKTDENVQRLTRLPISKIRHIMKFDDEVTAASKEALYLVTKATELFIEDFSKEVHQCTLASKKKTVSKRDVDTAIFSQDYFIFLDGALD